LDEYLRAEPHFGIEGIDTRCAGTEAGNSWAMRGILSASILDDAIGATVSRGTGGGQIIGADWVRRDAEVT